MQATKVPYRAYMRARRAWRRDQKDPRLDAVRAAAWADFVRVRDAAWMAAKEEGEQHV
jgi:hypothetical protein